MDSEQLQIASFLTRARELYPQREMVGRGADGVVRRTTLGRYAERVDRLRGALRELGVGPGDRVGTLAWNDQRHLELYMAVPSSAATLHTINLRLGADQVAAIVGHAGDRVLFVDPSVRELVLAALALMSDPPPVVLLGWPGDDLPPGWLCYEELLERQADPDAVAALDIDERSPAAMCYSSATTGSPKGVLYSHRALYLHSAMLSMADTWAISGADTVLPVVPMFHVNAWGIPFTAIWMGARIVLPGVRPSAADIAALLHAEGVTFAAAVPTVWLDVVEVLAREGWELPRMRLMISGGGALPPALLERADSLGLPLIHSYGMTEASPLTHVNRPKPGPDEEAGEGRSRERRLRQGLLAPGLRMRVVDDDGEEVPADGESPGELQLRGPWVAESYADDPERSAQGWEEGWYRAGDIVNVDPDGYMLLVDRSQDLIKSGGEWISSVGLENALSEHPRVARAAAIGVPDPRWQERPLAFVQLAPGPEVDPEELRQWLESRLPRWWVPDRIEVVAEIPLTTVGKIDKRRLRAWA